LSDDDAAPASDGAAASGALAPASEGAPASGLLAGGAIVGVFPGVVAAPVVVAGRGCDVSVGAALGGALGAGERPPSSSLSPKRPQPESVSAAKSDTRSRRSRAFAFIDASWRGEPRGATLYAKTGRARL
jgi:hypothetical protein